MGFHCAGKCHRSRNAGQGKTLRYAKRHRRARICLPSTGFHFCPAALPRWLIRLSLDAALRNISNDVARHRGNRHCAVNAAVDLAEPAQRPGASAADDSEDKAPAACLVEVHGITPAATARNPPAPGRTPGTAHRTASPPTSLCGATGSAGWRVAGSCLLILGARLIVSCPAVVRRSWPPPEAPRPSR